MRKYYSQFLLITLFSFMFSMPLQAQEVSTDKAAVSNEDSDAKSPQLSNNIMHTVVAGETFYSISKLYGISMAHIKKLNGYTTNELDLGQQLQIGYAEDSKISTLEFWIVKKGETLYSIARVNNISVKELKVLNTLESETIEIGDKLKLR